MVAALEKGAAKVRWAIEIRKISLTSRNLSDLLERLGFKLVDGIEYPALVSSAIEACETAAEVFEIAKRLRGTFKETAQVDSDFMLGSVIDFSKNPPGRHVFLEGESCISTSFCSGAAITLLPPSGLSPTELLRWHTDNEELKYQALLEQQLSRLEPAFTNSKAAKVLELLSIKNPSAEVVYKIYELAEGHSSSRAVFHKQFAISQDDFDRFRDAVHNPLVSGDWARHANPETLRTANPMTKAEAEEFVRGIATKWLNSIRSSSRNKAPN